MPPDLNLDNEIQITVVNGDYKPILVSENMIFTFKLVSKIIYYQENVLTHLGNAIKKIYITFRIKHHKVDCWINPYQLPSTKPCVMIELY